MAEQHKPSRRQLIIGLAVGLVAGGGSGFAGGYFTGKSARGPRRPRKPQPPAHVQIAPHNVRLGPEHAKVTIVELFDFQ